MLYVFMYRLPLSNEHGCLPIGVTRIELWLNTYVVLLRLTIATPEISARTILKRPDDYRSIYEFDARGVTWAEAAFKILPGRPVGCSDLCRKGTD